jgi:hypothetical protein
MPKKVKYHHTSLAIPDELWTRIRIRALEEHRHARALLADALELYLSTSKSLKTVKQRKEPTT